MAIPSFTFSEKPNAFLPFPGPHFFQKWILGQFRPQAQFSGPEFLQRPSLRQLASADSAAQKFY